VVRHQDGKARSFLLRFGIIRRRPIGWAALNTVNPFSNEEFLVAKVARPWAG